MKKFNEWLNEIAKYSDKLVVKNDNNDYYVEETSGDHYGASFMSIKDIKKQDSYKAMIDKEFGDAEAVQIFIDYYFMYNTQIGSELQQNLDDLSTNTILEDPGNEMVWRMVDGIDGKVLIAPNESEEMYIVLDSDGLIFMLEDILPIEFGEAIYQNKIFTGQNQKDIEKFLYTVRGHIQGKKYGL